MSGSSDRIEHRGRSSHAEDKLICTALIGVCLAVVFHVWGEDERSIGELLAAAVHSVAIPLLSTSLLFYSSEEDLNIFGYHPSFKVAIAGTGTTLAIIGIVIVFFDISWIFGITFLLSCLIGVRYWARFVYQLRVKKAKDADAKQSGTAAESSPRTEEKAQAESET